MSVTVTAVEQLARPMASGGWRGHVDLPDVATAADDVVTIRGWVIDEHGNAPSTLDLRRESGITVVRTTIENHRPDVAAAVAGASDRCGYLFSFDAASAGPTLTIHADGVMLARIHLQHGVDTRDRDALSQQGEDVVLASLLRSDTPKWLIDVGAHDGTHLSNSSPFLAKGWSGVLVEPAPVPFQKLASKYTTRADVHCLQLACTNVEGEATLFLGADGGDSTNATLCTDDNEWFATTRSAESITVTTTTLAALCEQYRVPERFGLLLVDAEGMDFDVLSGLDAAPHRPDVVCTERYLHRPDKEAAKASLLRSWGMVHHGSVGWNDLWVLPD